MASLAYVLDAGSLARLDATRGTISRPAWARALMNRLLDEGQRTGSHPVPATWPPGWVVPGSRAGCPAIRYRITPAEGDRLDATCPPGTARGVWARDLVIRGLALLDEGRISLIPRA